MIGSVASKGNPAIDQHGLRASARQAFLVEAAVRHLDGGDALRRPRIKAERVIEHLKHSGRVPFAHPSDCIVELAVTASRGCKREGNIQALVRCA